MAEGHLSDKRASLKREALSASARQNTSGFWHCGCYLLNYRNQPLVMGILNVTPDSFSDGGKFLEKDKALDQALRLEDEGADVIDIGGESTRPGAAPVSLEEEIRRVLPVLEALAGRLRIPLSIDTRKSALAQRAIDSGAAIINDVSGLRHDPEMLALASREEVGLVIMHAKGSPKTMQEAPQYRQLMKEIRDFLSTQLKRVRGAKIARNRIVLDPGIGFGKTLSHNLEIIRNLDQLTGLGVPVMLGPSRKSFIGQLLKCPPEERLEGTAAALAIGLFQGARIFRVHDVAAMKRVLRVSEGIRKGEA